MTENKNIEVIDLREAARKLWRRRMLFCKVLPVVFVLSCAYILCIPRTYTSSLSLAPEMGGSSGIGGALGSLASSFGVDLGGMETGDAISPLLYPDLMGDNAFVVGLFSIRVKSGKEGTESNYYDYLKNQKRAFWVKPIAALRRMISPKPIMVAGAGEQDPYILSKDQFDRAEEARKDITISVNKKTGVISIMANAQDALICKTLADSVKEHLQVYITQYRTNKARIDMEYYEDIMNQSKAEYEEARRVYGNFADANADIYLPSFQSKLEDLENDLQLKYNTYSTMQTQYLAAKAKVQERTPAFTVVKGASVPLKPSKPKRMLFVIGMCFLAFLCISAYSLKDYAKSRID